MSSLRNFLDIRPGERRNTFAAFATLLAVTTGHTLLETARDAFFLAKLPASHLPWMYLIIVAIALVLSQLRAARADSKVGVAASLFVAACISTVFWALMVGGRPTHTVLYALYLWTGLFGSWAMVQIWTLLGRAHTMTQAKRLYGFIGAGSVLGGVFGALAARLSISLMSPRSAVLLAAGLFALAALPCMLVRLPADESVARPRRGTDVVPPRRPVTASFALLWENAFVRRVLGIVLVSTITVTIADYLFKAQISQEISDTKLLGKYLSTFYGITNTCALVTQLVVAPWVFRRVGVQRALFIFPSSILMAAGGVIFSAGALGAAFVLKGLDGAFRYSIHKTSTELLLVPVPDGTRERIKPIVDLVGSRGGQALASVTILALVAVNAASASTLGVIVLGLAVLWLGLAVTIRGLYLDVFRETLKSGGLSGKAELPELDLGALETLFAGLSSSLDSEVIASLELLAEQHRERLIPALILYHPSNEVVLRSLEIFTEMGRTDFVSIADRLNGHAVPEVAAAALRARTAVQPNKQLLLERLDDRSPHVSVTALVALLSRGWIDLAEADARLARLLEGKSWQLAAELARAIRTVAPKRGANNVVDDRFDDLLVELDELAPSFRDAPIDDLDRSSIDALVFVGPPDLQVRLEIARAMCARESPRFIPRLVGMLNRSELRPVARTALVGIPGALAWLDQAMGRTDLPRDVRIHLPRTIAMFEPRAAADVLVRHLADTRDGAVRFKTIRGLVKLRRNDPLLELDSDVVKELANDTLAHAEELRRWSVALASGGADAPASLRAAGDPLRAAHHLLVDLVRDKELHATQRLLILFELLQGDPFDDIWRGLRSSNPKSRASSMELLENLVQPPLRQRVLALLGDAADRAPASTPLPGALSYEGAIREILASSSRTLKTLAEYRARELGLDITNVKMTAPTEPSTLATTLAERIVDKARELLTPEVAPRRASRAPA